MVRVAALITFLACVVLSEAQHEPGFCAFYEQCGFNPLVDDSTALIPPIVPCLNYSPARHLTGAHYLKLKRVCPMLDNGESNTYACCSIRQLNSLDNMLRLFKVILLRCPSCADNFAHLHCINTCSPNQTQTVEVTKVMNITTFQNTMDTAVVAYKAFISTTFADSAFGSCKNVRIPATGGFAIGTMCGPYGATQCTPQYWYDFQGDSSNGLAPLDIDFKLINEGNTTGLPAGVVPYNGRALKCNETTPTGGEACSCQDCTESCQMIQISPTTSPFTLLVADGYLVVSIILFCLLTN